VFYVKDIFGLKIDQPRHRPRYTPMSDTFSKVEVITGVARRRRFSTDLKLAVIAETMQPGMSIS
jgi:transposase-like protein